MNKLKKQERFFRLVVVTICISMIFISAIHFTNSAKNLAKNRLDEALIKNSEHLRNSIEWKTYDILSTLEALSLFVSTFDNLYDGQSIKALESARLKNGYLNIAIDDLNGNAYDSEGNFFNVADREYFHKAKQGEMNVSGVLNSKITMENCIAYAVPILRDNQVIGVLHTTIALQEMIKLFDFEGLFAEETVFVVDREGNLILGNQDNYFGTSDNLSEQFKQGVEANHNDDGYITKKLDGKEKEIYYVVEESSDWYIFSTMNDEIVQNSILESNRMTFVLVTKIIAILIVFAYFIYLWDRKKNIDIKNQMEAMNTVLKHSPGGAMCYVYMDGKLRLDFASEGVCEILDLDKDAVDNRLKYGYREFIMDSDYRDVFDLTSDDCAVELYYRITTDKNDIKWVIDRRQIVYNEGVKYIYVSMLDITNMMNIQDELLVSEAKQRMILEGTNLMYFEYNVEKKEMTFSDAWLAFSGETTKTVRADSYSGNNLGAAKALVMIDLNAYVKEQGDNFRCERLLHLKNGKEHWFRIKGTILVDNNEKVSHVIGIFEDINDMVQDHQRLEEISLIDPLTGIYNKASAEMLIKQKMTVTNMYTQQVLFIIDVDNFKEINDTYGHLEGDEVLSQLGFKILNCFRKNDIVGRIGGDEFIAMMCDVDRSAHEIVVAKAQQVMRAIEEVKGSNNNINITCSIGIACFPLDSKDFEELFNNADSALYSVKNDGKSSYHFYQDIKK